MAGYGSAGNGGYGGYEHTYGLGQDENIDQQKLQSQSKPVNESPQQQDAGGQQIAVGKQIPFFATSVPTQLYIKALQKMIGAPVTGVWDEHTHNALWVWWQANAGAATPELVVAGGAAIPAFGADPERAARVAVQPLLDAGDQSLFGLYAPLLQLLNLPSTNMQDYMTVMQSNVNAVETAMKAIQDHVVQQEKAGAEAAVAASAAAEAAAAAAAAAGNGAGTTTTSTTTPMVTTTPTTTGTVVAPAKSYTWVWWLVGAAALGGLVWALSRKGEGEETPEPAPVPTGEFGKVRIPRKGETSGCGCGG